MLLAMGHLFVYRGLINIMFDMPCIIVAVYQISCNYRVPKNNGLIHLKLEHVVVYEKSSDKFNIGHCLIKVKATARL